MKTYFELSALVGLFLFCGAVVQASEPIVTLDYIEQSPVVPGEDTEVTVPGFPYQITFFGTVTHEGQGNLQPIRLSATINDELIYGPEKVDAEKDQTTADYAIPWIVPAPGSYSVAIFSTHQDKRQDEVGCKAAPAVAAEYLKTNEIPRGGTHKPIAAVAKETGKDGELWAKRSCQEGYVVRTIEVAVGELDS